MSTNVLDGQGKANPETGEHRGELVGPSNLVDTAADGSGYGTARAAQLRIARETRLPLVRVKRDELQDLPAYRLQPDTTAGETQAHASGAGVSESPAQPAPAFSDVVYTSEAIVPLPPSELSPELRRAFEFLIAQGQPSLEAMMRAVFPDCAPHRSALMAMRTPAEARAMQEALDRWNRDLADAVALLTPTKHVVPTDAV